MGYSVARIDTFEAELANRRRKSPVDRVMTHKRQLRLTINNAAKSGKCGQ
uniref:Uncharacterized protein n=1 Tax=Hyaloperonospora arabidopsidis (strain Emoy2) TaxID=559515 RepID=M4BSM7_HYAAE